MTLSDDFLIGATILGPIFAVQAQKWLERTTEKRRRKLGIFYSLMATRASRLAPDHVRALNQIDLEFSGARFNSYIQWQTPKEKAVANTWRSYSDHLNERVEETKEAIEGWLRRGDDLFVDLLFALSNYFGFAFDKVQLRRGVYSPRAHSEAETRQQAIQTHLLNLLTGDSPLKMNVVGFPVSQDALDRQESLQKALLKCLSPDTGIPVAAVHPSQSTSWSCPG